MQFKKNQGLIDRFLKILAGGVLLFLASYLKLHTILVAVMFIVALWSIVTGLVGYCPLYNLLGINTRKEK
jgi:uncharacterized membrane protein